ncbi:N-acetylneuraminate synthase family protein [Roseovarius nanhaiticus]|uniref:N-acetylneuraminate synthase family protein n=1 Tax=Roseovarius nanhaiticus TaxID=573024 RepID=UPI0024919F6C|nr:N-acetylneuraminate synthase family protein [Roseovarius nanhaiticus]
MQALPHLEIGGRRIAADAPTYVIAEIGVNHNGDAALAHKMIDAAKATGADAVKFQTFRTEDLVLKSAAKADYQNRTTGLGNQFDMLQNLELPFGVFSELRDHCREVGIDFMSTAFDPHSLEHVASLSPVCLKWPSGELTNWPLLRRAKATGLPIMLSTGMGSLHEIAAAMDLLGSDAKVVILQCVSNYPARIEDQNLRVLPVMQAAFGCPVGFSDHTIGPYAALAARALGMAVLEKHFTLDNTMEGPDHSASIEPAEFTQMVGLLRQIEEGLGDGVKRPRPSEENVRSVARKSLVYRRDLPAGHVLSEDDLIGKRPGGGVGLDRIDLYTGRMLAQAVTTDQMLEPDHVR